MTELHLSLPSWLLALFAVIWTAQLLVDWRLKYWTKRLAEEKARIKKEHVRAWMDRASGKVPR